MRRRWTWTELQEKRAAEVIDVVDELHPYWPLTLRQIYYRLVAAGDIDNTRSSYNLLSKLVKWMRIDERIPWSAITDRARAVSPKRGVSDLQTFVEEERAYFLNGYSRCRIQGQDRYIEVWYEKDALTGLFRETVTPYCIRSVVCRGYQSVTFLADYYQRATAAISKGQHPLVLYFGDLDPSGIQMLEASIETLGDELDLYGVEFKRIALTPEQVHHYQLPVDPTAAKPSDSRYASYVKRYGTIAVELDALHPQQLIDLIKASIEAEIDMEGFSTQAALEIRDRTMLRMFRDRVSSAIDDIWSDMFDKPNRSG